MNTFWFDCISTSGTDIKVSGLLHLYFNIQKHNTQNIKKSKYTTELNERNAFTAKIDLE